MTLKELLDVFDKNRDGIKIQICKFGDWEEFGIVWSDGSLIRAIEGVKVECASAVAKDMIRVDLL